MWQQRLASRAYVTHSGAFQLKGYRPTGGRVVDPQNIDILTAEPSARPRSIQVARLPTDHSPIQNEATSIPD